MEQENSLCFNGFRFENTEDVQDATAEFRKIQYLESKIDYADIKKVQAIYEKAVKEKVFHTAPGLFYLKGIRDFLVREDERYEAVLPCVPMQGIIHKEQETENRAKTRTAQAKRDEKRKNEIQEQKTKFRLSVIINCVLGVAVLFMLWVALHTEEPNILNYEKAIKNRYAAWEQELTDREKTIRQKELELFRDSD